MIRVQYDDSVIANKLYCTLQVQREMCEGEYAFFYMSRWFGSAEILPPQGRGELLALAGTTGPFRHEMMLISPNTTSDPDDSLANWRSKFQRIQYCAPDIAIEKLLEAESKVLSDSDERAVVDDIKIKGLDSTVFYNCNIEATVEGGLQDLSLNAFIYVLVQPPAKILGFRRVFSQEHLRTIIEQANFHGLQMYCSEFVLEGKYVVAKGPWFLFPARLRDIGTSQAPEIAIIQSDDEIPPQFQDVDPATRDAMHQDDQRFIDKVHHLSDHHKIEIVKDSDGLLICPYCGKKFKKRHGLSNHVRTIHPDEYDAYKQLD